MRSPRCGKHVSHNKQHTHARAPDSDCCDAYNCALCKAFSCFRQFGSNIFPAAANFVSSAILQVRLVNRNVVLTTNVI